VKGHHILFCKCLDDPHHKCSFVKRSFVVLMFHARVG
jgi:hypothetical protein